MKLLTSQYRAGSPGPAEADSRPRAQTLQADQAPARSGAGQPCDLRTLFDRHYASVWRLLRRFGVLPAQLDDAAQEVFWVAARRMSDLQSGREMAFLYGVALRVASNEVRRRKSAPVGDQDDLAAIVDPQPSPEECLDQRRARALLDQVLDRMPLELRTVFVLFELEGLEVREIAELEALPLGTASSRLRRAREEFSAIAKRINAALAARGGQR
jgi:RNA polymerase sigma-70 factor (ECF subfamily)